jgi:hypothetical protein
MTPHIPDIEGGDRPSFTCPSCGARVDITPEMIDRIAANAGSYDYRFESRERAAERIIWAFLEEVCRQ